MYSDGKSYEEILTTALRNPILSSYDKREGSVIYNALAPLCLELANLYLKMDIMDEQSYLISAVGENLDLRVSDYGLKREQATYSKRKVVFKDKNGTEMDVPIGSRFSVPNDNTLIYKYIGYAEDSTLKVVECETAGSIGNSYIGTILPLQYITGLAVAEIVDLPYVPADDVETDAELRSRALKFITNIGFGGNIQDYINYVTAITGVGACKVYPVYAGGGTVLITIVDTNRRAVSADFIQYVKDKVDPEDGNGIGIAPIGHFVTITTPVESPIAISFKITLEEEIVLDNIKEYIVNEIEKYLTTERKKFGQDTKSLTVTRSQIIYACLSVSGVTNVYDVMLNNENADIELTDKVITDAGGHVTDIKQFIPVLNKGALNIEVIR